MNRKINNIIQNLPERWANIFSYFNQNYSIEGGVELSNFNDNRVSWEPAPVRSGDHVHINYQGLLRNSGADEVFIHYGVDGWHNLKTTRMQRMSDGIFGAELRADASREINVCFKDSANNWDNNSGWNWKVDIQ